MDTEEVVRVQVLFKIKEGKLDYTDSLYFGKEEYESMKKEVIEQKKMERFNSWKQVVTTPVPPVPKEKQLEEVDKQILETNQQLAELTKQKKDIQAIGVKK